ncbi:MAG: rod shape-determining protein MreC [bacterium]|nr:rod shape-determining protein MreC [bacterium]
MRSWRSNRLLFFAVCMTLCSGLILVSAAGALAPVEGLVATPLNFIAGIFNDISQTVNSAAVEFSEIQRLRERNAELEEALAQFQAELVELRETSSDYQLLTSLLDYTTTAENQEFVTADVINFDQSGVLRTLVINRGTRDGISRGMPVVTNLGLVGRILEVSANASRVLLITDSSSFVSARLQTSREEGSVRGELTGNLRMIDIPLDAVVQEGDLVLTSGLGGNFPSDIVIGQVQSIRQFEFELAQEAEVRSLVNFDTLEFVLVITSFQPVDISVFETEEEGAP